MEDAKSNLEGLNKILGFGNENAKFIFFGIEEGGDWQFPADKLLLDIYISISKQKNLISNEDFNEFKYSINSRSKFYPLIENILKIEKDKVGSINEDVSVLNLFPIARKSSNLDYLKSYNYFFGIKDRNHYLSEHWQSRINIFAKYFENRKNKIIICMGKGYWNDFKKVLGIVNFTKNEFEYKTVETKRKYEFYLHKTNKIFLVDHPSRNWLKADHLAEIIEISK